MAPQARLERATRGLGNRCSIHLSYWGTVSRIIVTSTHVDCNKQTAKWWGELLNGWFCSIEVVGIKATSPFGRKRLTNMTTGLLVYGNGCKKHNDCFTCPENDCTTTERFKGKNPILDKCYFIIDTTQPKPQSCKYCGGTHISRYGSYNGVKLYFCCDCKKKFSLKGNLYKMHVPYLYVERAYMLRKVELLNFREIAKYFKTNYGFSPSPSSVYRWAKRGQRIISGGVNENNHQ